jgi:hypothetical protein
MVTVRVPGSDDPLTVSVTGRREEWFEEALVSHNRFLLASGGSAPDVAVYLKDFPDEPIAAPALYIFPTGASGSFRLRKIVTASPDSSFSPGHPVTRNLSFRNFRPLKLVDLDLPGSGKVIATAGGLPLVSVGLAEGVRYSVWHFDPADSGIYLDPAFPVLLRESINWLAGLDLGTSGLLDPRLTMDSALVSLPDLELLDKDLATVSVTSDIALPFMILAFLIFLLLVADRAISREAA